jgi:hypothetical protein
MMRLFVPVKIFELSAGHRNFAPIKRLDLWLMRTAPGIRVLTEEQE